MYFSFCGFWSNRTLPYFPLSSSVRLSVTGVTSQLSLIIWWFRPWKPYFSECISSMLIVLTTWTTWTTWITWITWTTWTTLTSEHPNQSNPDAAQSSSVESITVQYSPVQPSTAQYSPVHPSTSQYIPVQPSTAQYNPVKLWIAQSRDPVGLPLDTLEPWSTRRAI